MTGVLAQSRAMTLRHLRALWRQPAFVAITLVQPVMWLLLFGALFTRVADIPGFDADSYIAFLTPGIVIMTALFSAGWSGMAAITDLDRGVVDRFLVTPAHRFALVAGPLGQQKIVTIVQSAIILLLALAAGARFPGGLPAAILLILYAVLLSVFISGLSIALALVARKEETVIAAVNLVMLPVTFLSTALMPRDLVPGWVAAIARWNPASWAAEGGRAALEGRFSAVDGLLQLGGLAVLAAIGCWLATRAYGVYRRAV